MLKLSLISLGFTVVLALAEAIRIRIVYGKKQNIDHHISTGLAIGAAMLAILFYGLTAHGLMTKRELLRFAILLNLFGWPLCGLVRLVAYNPILNLFRILTKTNPTGRIDYVSDKTTSETDNFKWWKKLGFWQQRAIAFAGWGLLIWLYYKVC